MDFGSIRITMNDAFVEPSEDNEDEDDKSESTPVDAFVEEVIKEELMKEDDKNIRHESTSDLSSRLEAMDLSEQAEPKVDSGIKVIRESISQEANRIERTLVNIELEQSFTIKEQPYKVHKKPPSPKEIIMKLENIVRSWFTFETFCFILGEEKVRQELDSYGLNLQLQNSDPYLYDRYADLCKRLNLLELEETYGTKEVESPKKPLPDFNKLREESQKLEIKVKSFFKGNMEFEIEDEEDTANDILPVLPPLDHYATKAARRRIFLQKLCHV